MIFVAILCLALAVCFVGIYFNRSEDDVLAMEEAAKKMHKYGLI